VGVAAACRQQSALDATSHPGKMDGLKPGRDRHAEAFEQQVRHSLVEAQVYVFANAVGFVFSLRHLSIGCVDAGRMWRADRACNTGRSA
jgi:hypothetical protein